LPKILQTKWTTETQETERTKNPEAATRKGKGGGLVVERTVRTDGHRKTFRVRREVCEGRRFRSRGLF